MDFSNTSDLKSTKYFPSNNILIPALKTNTLFLPSSSRHRPENLLLQPSFTGSFNNTNNSHTESLNIYVPLSTLPSICEMSSAKALACITFSSVVLLLLIFRNGSYLRIKTTRRMQSI